MGKIVVINPTEEQSIFYEHVFDEIVFNRTLSTIKLLLKEEKSYFSFKHSLQREFGYDNVEDIDHCHNNKFFDPQYKSNDKDSCDFLMIGVWSNFEKIIDGLENASAAARISIVWNDMQKQGWINDVTIYFSKSSAYFMKPLCTTDLSGKTITNWRWKNKLPEIISPHNKIRYTDNSNVSDIEDLKEFISFLIHEEKVPCKVHAFERFENILHPKTGRPFFNEQKAGIYTRLLDEGYTAYVKLHRKMSYDSYLMSLQRKL